MLDKNFVEYTETYNLIIQDISVIMFNYLNMGGNILTS